MSSRANVTKRACDGCKIRKIRCGGGQPCKGCLNARIQCTYIRVQQPRGPRRIRFSTRLLIEETQRGQPQNGPEPTAALPQTPGVGCRYTDPANFMPVPVAGNVRKERWSSHIPTTELASVLYIYHVRMFPVWPIVDTQELVSSLQADVERTDQETYAMATAIAAATIAQLRLVPSSLPGDEITAHTLAVECLRARRAINYKSVVNLNRLRTSFFLHIYYENQDLGGTESLLYLREAITMAQMMNLHQESTYVGLSRQEQELRRRVLWLLFITERGVCILHQLPVVLKTDIALPQIDVNDGSQVLPAFLELLDLFRLLEHSKIFDIVQNQDALVPALMGGVNTAERDFLEALQQQLQQRFAPLDQMSDVQKADLCVTRHWMRMILWKLASKKGLLCSPSSDQPMSWAFPVIVARELLTMVSQLPRSAIEAHGLGMGLKIYEIANSLADVVTGLTSLRRPLEWNLDSGPGSVLARLHSILLTFRGGVNKALVDLLNQKLTEAQSKYGMDLLTAPLTIQLPVQVGDKQFPRGRVQSIDEADEPSSAAIVALPTRSFTDYGFASDTPLTAEEVSIALTAGLDGGGLQYYGDFEMERMPAEEQQSGAFDAASSVSYQQFSQAKTEENCAATEDLSAVPVEPTNDIAGTLQAVSFSPSWSPLNSVEALIGDFISSIPESYTPDIYNFERVTSANSNLPTQSCGDFVD